MNNIAKKIDLFRYRPPTTKEIKRSFHKVHGITPRGIKAVKQFMNMQYDDRLIDIYKNIPHVSIFIGCAKSGIATYAYYINYPHIFGNDPVVASAWIMRRIFKRYMALAKVMGYNVKGIRLKRTYMLKYKDFILRELETDARIVARRAYDVLIQIDDGSLRNSMI